jgi:iron(III) transport system permease protein
MLMMAPFAMWQYRIVNKRSYSTLTGSHRSNRVRLRRWRWPLFGVAALYLLVALVIPSALLVVGTFMKFFGAFDVPQPWTLSQWSTVLSDPIFIQSLVNTLILGLGAAVLAMAWFSLAAYTIVRYRGVSSRVLDFLCWLPWAVPGIIMGLGFLWMVLSVGFLRPLHSTMLIMILAVTLGAITPGTQMIKAGLLQIDKDLEGASRVGGASFLYTLRRIVIPLLAPTLVAVGILTFVAAVRDIGRIVFVVGGTNRPLSMLQLDLIVSERLEAAAVVGVIITILSLGVAMLVRTGGLHVSSKG